MENLLASMFCIHSFFSPLHSIINGKLHEKNISTNNPAITENTECQSAHPRYSIKSGNVAVPLLALYLPKSQTDAIMCVLQIVTYDEVVEKGMEHKGEQR